MSVLHVELDAAARRLIDEHYQRLEDRLGSLDLESVLTSTDPYMLRVQGVGRATEIVEAAMHAAMRPDESMDIRQLAKAQHSHTGERCEAVLMRSLGDYVDSRRSSYDTLWAQALNRLSRLFVNTYVMADGRIDWEQLSCHAPKPTP